LYNFNSKIALWNILLKDNFPFLNKWNKFLDVCNSFLEEINSLVEGREIGCEF
jgi:hypothetical protein